MITAFKYLPNYASFSRLTENNQIYIKISGELAVPKKIEPTDKVNPVKIMPNEEVFKLAKKDQ